MKINIVIPCYNEEEVLPLTIVKMQELTQRLKKETGADGHLLFVDDGSHDKTWALITEYANKYNNVGGLKLSHNEGHQNALWAGMEQGLEECDAMVSIDADLQDDENAIIEMTQQIQQGKDIVYGVRKERKTDTWFKRTTALGFYSVMRRVDPEMIYNHADFRMMNRRATEALMQYGERNLFLRGVVRMLGFEQGFVYYDRKAREAGESKYPLKKMIQFSIDGITSFSVAPMKWITFAGLGLTFISLIMLVFIVVDYLRGDTVQGWASIMFSLWFIGGIVTTSIGISGVYTGKIYTEVKHRPRYFVEERVGTERH